MFVRVRVLRKLLQLENLRPALFKDSNKLLAVDSYLHPLSIPYAEIEGMSHFDSSISALRSFIVVIEANFLTTNR
jgi:hypothetical protein